MSKTSVKIQVTIFILFIGVFFALNIFLPAKDFSERENRYLKQMPKFTLERLFSGKFTSDFETYTTDQFVFRDTWTTLKARAELAMGKKENKGIYLTEDGSLIEGFKQWDEKRLESNVKSVNRLAENSDIPVFFALIPSASEIWSYKLPKAAPNARQADAISYAYENTDAITIDVHSALKEHDEEYIYYRTDHHWTSLGAFYGYEAIMEAMDITSSPLSSYERQVVSDDFFGTVYSSSGISWAEPDSIEIFVQPDESVSVTVYSDGGGSEGQIYDFSFLDKKDKYSMFMGGNTPLLEISTGNLDKNDLPRLLILRDSYMDCLTPFFLEHFSEIHIIDLRYYKLSINEYIEANDIDSALVCYSVSNFVTDTGLFLMER